MARGFVCFKEALEMESKTRNNELKYAVSGKEKMNTGATDKIYT